MGGLGTGYPQAHRSNYPGTATYPEPALASSAGVFPQSNDEVPSRIVIDAPQPGETIVLRPENGYMPTQAPRPSLP